MWETYQRLTLVSAAWPKFTKIKMPASFEKNYVESLYIGKSPQQSAGEYKQSRMNSERCKGCKATQITAF